MKYVRSVVVGLVAAIVSAIGYIFISGSRSFQQSPGGTFSESTLEFAAGPKLLFLLTAVFAVGFLWTLRWTSKHLK
jgi:phosphatidylglycerophosphate synthase